MSTELIDYINKLNIFVYVLTDGSTVLGKLVEVHENAIELIGLCKIGQVFVNNTIQQMLLPVIPASLEQTSILAKAHIIIQSPASLTLKKAYCDSLVKFKLNKVSNDPSNQSTNLETFEPNKESKNPFKDRWN